MLIVVVHNRSNKPQTSEVESLRRENDVLAAENERLRIFLDEANLALARWEDWATARPATYKEQLRDDPAAPPGAISQKA